MNSTLTMMTTTMNKAYDSFAGIYDQLMDDVDYDRWALYYRDLLLDGQEVKPSELGRVVECACGTGNLTVRLARMGFKMLGVDSSGQMLRVAEEKMRTFGVDCPLIAQDMRKLQVPGRNYAVLCTCDGLNYLREPEDVRHFFAAAARVLRPGGLLCLDLSTRYKLETVIGNAFLGEERPGMAYLWQNTYHAETQSVRMDITFFVQEQDGRYRRFREEHRLRAYETDMLSEMLQAAGFEQIEFFGGMSLERPKPMDERIHLRARLKRA